MSLYNMINGFNQACVIILPMLGRKPEDYPRFRDCFVVNNSEIGIFTRVGGNNRNCGFGEEELLKDPNFLRTFDDSFDSTYGFYIFRVPDKWKKDFDLICGDRTKEVSDEYVNYVKEFYPKLAENGTIDLIFRNTAGGQDVQKPD